MTKMAVNVACQAGGTTLVTVSWESQQQGGNSDRAQFRIVRRGGSGGEIALPSAPQFYMGGQRDVRSWTFPDVNVPETTNYDYVLQINRVLGAGTFYAMSMVANHYRR